MGWNYWGGKKKRNGLIAQNQKCDGKRKRKKKKSFPLSLLFFCFLFPGRGGPRGGRVGSYEHFRVGQQEPSVRYFCCPPQTAECRGHRYGHAATETAALNAAPTF